MLLFVFAASISGDILQTDVSDYPKTFQKRLKAAQQAFQAEQWEDALRLYRALAKEAPELAIVYIGEGDTAAKLKDYPAAITAFAHALKRLSTEQQTHISIARLQFIVQAKLATAYHRNKQLDAADIWFQKAIKGAGEEAPAAWYVALGQIETERGNLEQARRYYIVAVQLHPETTAAYNNLGHVLLKLNRIDEADAVFREALVQDETLASAAFGRGEVGVKRGQLTVAQRFYQNAIQHAPHEPTFHKSLAEVLRDLGNDKEAEVVEARYRRTLAERYLRQAHWFIERRQAQRALIPLQKALDVDANVHTCAKRLRLCSDATRRISSRQADVSARTHDRTDLPSGTFTSRYDRSWTRKLDKCRDTLSHTHQTRTGFYGYLRTTRESTREIWRLSSCRAGTHDGNRTRTDMGHPGIYGAERFIKNSMHPVWQKPISVAQSNLHQMCRFQKRRWQPYSQQKIENLPKHRRSLRLSLKAIAARYTVPRLPLSIIVSTVFPMHDVKLKPLLHRILSTPIF